MSNVPRAISERAFGPGISVVTERGERMPPFYYRIARFPTVTPIGVATPS